LIRDLQARGMLDNTLVIWMGECGRTPRINARGAQPGRDHYPRAWSCVMAGGGIRGGQVIGESDSIGAYPKLRPTTPADIHATVYASLGYDCKSISYQSSDGRPIPLTDGTPIAEVL